MSSPWDFGWTQVLTLIGFLITVTIAIAGFRSFGRWKREKLEEKRIEIALEALSLAYESREVFEMIRNPGSFGHEWADMPRKEQMTESEWNQRGPFYAIMKRVQDQNSFFDRVAKLRPRFLAVFGTQNEECFKFIKEARAYVFVSAKTLCFSPPGYFDAKAVHRMECDIWEGIAEGNNVEDRVGKKVDRFVTLIESLCRPIVDRSYSPKTTLEKH